MGEGFRNNRLLIIFTLLGFLFIVFKYILNIVKNIFGGIYVKYGVGIDHLFSVSLLTGLIFLIIVTLLYCYFEAYNFGQYSYLLKIKYAQRADEWYKKVLDSIYMCTVFCFLFLASISIFKNIIVFMLFLAILLLFISMLYIKVVVIGTTNSLLINIYTKTIGFYINLPFAKLSKIWIILYLFLLFITVPIVMNSYLNANLEVKYSIPNKQDAKLIFIFSDISSDKMPNSLNLSIINSKATKTLVLKSMDFTSTGIQVVNGNENEEIEKKSPEEFFELFSDKKLILKSLNYKAKSITNIGSYLQEGDNEIVVSFSIGDSIIFHKEYTIVENIQIQGSKIKINQKRSIVKL